MTKLLSLALVLAFFGCPVPPIPQPSPQPDSSYCAAMCAHIGPQGLNCPEGQPVYDNSLPPSDAGRGAPNESCTDFCTKQQANGVWINPRCVSLVTTCGGIEAARQKNCD
jgi:hypothetical protein